MENTAGNFRHPLEQLSLEVKIVGEEEEVKRSRHVIAKQKARLARQKLDSLIEDQFQSGRLLACIASRPGQSGRADGYILEGDELTFYKKKMERRKRG